MTKSKQVLKNNKITNLDSVPLCCENKITKLHFSEDDFQTFKIIGKENDQSREICINDEIFHLEFRLNLKRRKALVFKHLRIVNLNNENNAEIIFSKNLFTNMEVFYLNPIYRAFVKKFTNKYDYKL